MKRSLMAGGALMALMACVAGLAVLRPERLTAATRERSAVVRERLDAFAVAQAKDEKPPAAAVDTKPAESAQMPKPAGSAPAKAGSEATPVKVKFECSNGNVVLEIHKEWAPNGAARFLELVKMGFFDGNRFFRVVTQPREFVVQWGIPGDPKLAQEWWEKNIPDDPVRQSNKKGMLTFAAGSMPNSRSTQLFINRGDNSMLDGMGFAPIGQVVEGMDDVVMKFNSQYQEDITDKQGEILAKGNEWLDKEYPGLDYIKKASILEK